MKPCTYLGCDAAPITVIQPTYGIRWFGCASHAGQMSSALGGSTYPIASAPEVGGTAWAEREGSTWIDQL